MKGILTLSLIAITFIWIGMVLGISFLEAPLKFTAPGITTKLGVGIGQVVFQALNKVELTLSLVVIICLLLLKTTTQIWVLYGIALVILGLQSLYLLPILDDRVDSILSGITPSPSYHHVAFILFELAKILVLLSAGITLTKSKLLKEI